MMTKNMAVEFAWRGRTAYLYPEIMELFLCWFLVLERDAFVIFRQSEFASMCNYEK